jgi:hypothetical protein
VAKNPAIWQQCFIHRFTTVTISEHFLTGKKRRKEEKQFFKE